MAMTTVNKVLFEGTVTKVPVSRDAKQAEADIKKFRAALDADNTGNNSLVVRTETGDVYQLSESRVKQAAAGKIFGKGDQVIIDGKPARTLFHEEELPKRGELFASAAFCGGLIGAALGFIGSVAVAADGVAMGGALGFFAPIAAIAAVFALIGGGLSLFAKSARD